MAEINKAQNRSLRKKRVRAKIVGTTERPRLSVRISNKNVSAQIIDDSVAETLASATSVGKKATGSLSEIAAQVGADIAKAAKKAKVSKVAFDRNGRQYAQRLKAFADAARKEGLEF